MITSKTGWREVLYGAPKFFLMKRGRRPFSISLDFLGEGHDRNRGRPGLFAHLAEVASKFVAAGIDNLVCNSVLMDTSNAAPTKKCWGIGANFNPVQLRPSTAQTVDMLAVARPRCHSGYVAFSNSIPNAGCAV